MPSTHTPYPHANYQYLHQDSSLYVTAARCLEDQGLSTDKVPPTHLPVATTPLTTYRSQYRYWLWKVRIGRLSESRLRSPHQCGTFVCGTLGDVCTAEA